MDATPGDVSKVVVENREGKRELRSMFWGLKRRAIQAPGSPPTHARAESLLDRPMFQDLVSSGRRCILPMKSWFEGQSLVRVDGESVIAVAGIYDAWVNPDGTTMESFCLVTVEAAPAIRRLNNRMPAILHREDEALWLSRVERDMERILGVLRPFEGTLIVESERSGDGGMQQSLDLMPPRRSD